MLEDNGRIAQGSIKYRGQELTDLKSNNGIGIRNEDLPKIFDKGYSGFNGRLNQKSSGIGLYMAKRIAHKLSITIDAESKVGKGSSFFIYFG